MARERKKEPAILPTLKRLCLLKSPLRWQRATAAEGIPWFALFANCVRSASEERAYVGAATNCPSRRVSWTEGLTGGGCCYSIRDDEDNEEKVAKKYAPRRGPSFYSVLLLCVGHVVSMRLCRFFSPLRPPSNAARLTQRRTGRRPTANASVVA